MEGDVNCLLGKLHEKKNVFQTKLRSITFFFFKILFVFRERGREGQREGEKH